MHRQYTLPLLAALSCAWVSAAPPSDLRLERAKQVFDEKMKQIEEDAANAREKATATLRKEYDEVIAKKKKAGDEDAVAFFEQEATDLLGADGAEGFQKRRKAMPLAQLQPLRFQGEVGFKTEWEKIVPAVDGRLTTEPFLWSPFDAASDWQIPKGAKTFEAYGHIIRPFAHATSDCILEVRIDGKPAARSPPLTNDKRTHKFVVEIPRGAKTLTLITDPNKGSGDGDMAVWVEPCFYDR